MSGFTPTADLYDRDGERLGCCDIQFRQFGGRTRFAGRIVTVSSREDNAILKQVLACPGEGRVVVVDSGGGVHCAMLGDNMAATAADNGWAGLIIHGAVRDAAALAGLPIGIKALGTNPRRSLKHGAGEIDVPVAFGGLVFWPGDMVVSDEDGIVVLPATNRS